MVETAVDIVAPAPVFVVIVCPVVVVSPFVIVSPVVVVDVDLGWEVTPFPVEEVGSVYGVVV